MREATVYVAMDGSRFDSAAECRAHEREHAHLALVNLSHDQVQAALDRSNPELADAIETVAYRISQVRKAAGEFKRQRKTGETPDATPGEATTTANAGGENVARQEAGPTRPHEPKTDHLPEPETGAQRASADRPDAGAPSASEREPYPYGSGAAPDVHEDRPPHPYSESAEIHPSAGPGEPASPPAGTEQRLGVGSPGRIQDEETYLDPPGFLDRTKEAAA